jgi:hypothetical protein
MTIAPERPPMVPRPWRPRFGLGTLLLAMLVVSVVSALGYYAAQAFAVASPRSAQLIFILFTVASAPLLVVAVSIFYQIYLWFERMNKR